MKLRVPDAAVFNSLRTSLLRKFRSNALEFKTLGFQWQYADEYIKFDYDKESGQVEIKLTPKSERKTRATRWEPVDL